MNLDPIIRCLLLVYGVPLQIIVGGIHVFKADGGAHSIGGFDLSGPDGKTIIAFVGQMGNLQMYYGGIICLNALVGDANILFYTTWFTLMVSAYALAYKVAGFKSLLEHSADAPGPKYKPYLLAALTSLMAILAGCNLSSMTNAKWYVIIASVVLVVIWFTVAFRYRSVSGDAEFVAL
eukprot:gnl/MRDRNA2_/MRDRNA2_196885_c0_seq1.p1 gnl/MRDRNA2_/MRDRNA2_196885_c0~~gnl/MRDRNA2_/MRDRNA2_196885_c0_seq1.p1  ORF type:complete len:178 (+),score=16.03 gnl/MRDRNA2_/MRDRNA2_196885_c0_seq1:109-642(+)